MKRFNAILFAGAVCLTACKQTPKDSAPSTTADSPYTKCYRYSNGKDSVLASITFHGDSVHGTLAYHLFEKDKNTGTLEGNITNDLLVAEYSFQSEGVLSARQVTFKKQGDDLIEGYGAADSLKFDDAMALKEADCPQ